MIGQANPIQRVGNENERLCRYSEDGPSVSKKKKKKNLGRFLFWHTMSKAGDKLSPYYPFAHKRWQLEMQRELQYLRNSEIIRGFVSERLKS